MEKEVETLNTSIEYINNIKKLAKEISDKINSGEENNGIKLIYFLVDEFQLLIQLIEITKKNHDGKITIGNTNSILSEIIEAMENEDYVLVGDLFEYEFIPVLEEIQNEIKNFVAEY